MAVGRLARIQGHANAEPIVTANIGPEDAFHSRQCGTAIMAPASSARTWVLLPN
jgi:hypothetical protein